MNYFVYILQSVKDPDQYYVGYSTNLKERIKTHNNGDSVHTNKFKPWKLKTYLCFSSKEKAKNFESYLKSGSGKAFRNKRLI